MSPIAVVKPFAVVKHVHAEDLAAHYEHMDEVSRVDLSHLREKAREIRAEGSSEAPVEWYASRDEADAEVQRRRSANALPGVTFWSEYIDD